MDSDDEAPPAPAQKQSLNAKKALIRAPTMNTVATEDRITTSPGPEAATTSDVSTPSSETKGEVLVPATTSGRRSTTSKVLRFSDVHIPAPDFNAALSSPPTVPTSTLKSALVKKLPNARSSIVQESSPCISAATAAAKKSAAVKVNDVLDDLSKYSIVALSRMRLTMSSSCVEFSHPPREVRQSQFAQERPAHRRLSSRSTRQTEGCHCHGF